MELVKILLIVTTVIAEVIAYSCSPGEIQETLCNQCTCQQNGKWHAWKCQKRSCETFSNDDLLHLYRKYLEDPTYQRPEDQTHTTRKKPKSTTPLDIDDLTLDVASTHRYHPSPNLHEATTTEITEEDLTFPISEEPEPSLSYDLPEIMETKTTLEQDYYDTPLQSTEPKGISETEEVTNMGKTEPVVAHTSEMEAPPVSEDNTNFDYDTESKKDEYPTSGSTTSTHISTDTTTESGAVSFTEDGIIDSSRQDQISESTTRNIPKTYEPTGETDETREETQTTTETVLNESSTETISTELHSDETRLEEHSTEESASSVTDLVETDASETASEPTIDTTLPECQPEDFITSTPISEPDSSTSDTAYDSESTTEISDSSDSPYTEVDVSESHISESSTEDSEGTGITSDADDTETVNTASTKSNTDRTTVGITGSTGPEKSNSTKESGNTDNTKPQSTIPGSAGTQNADNTGTGYTDRTATAGNEAGSPKDINADNTTSSGSGGNSVTASGNGTAAGNTEIAGGASAKPGGKSTVVGNTGGTENADTAAGNTGGTGEEGNSKAPTAVGTTSQGITEKSADVTTGSSGNSTASNAVGTTSHGITEKSADVTTGSSLNAVGTTSHGITEKSADVTIGSSPNAVGTTSHGITEKSADVTAGSS